MKSKLNNAKIPLVFTDSYYELDKTNDNQINKLYNYENFNYIDSLTKIYLEEVFKIPLLTPNEENNLLIRVSRGDKVARKRFIEAYLFLVINIAKTMVGRGLSFSDLIEEGNLGLIEAVDKFDINKNLKFSTYASLLIYWRLCNAIYVNGRNVRLPNGFYSKVLKCKKIQKELEDDLGYEPAIEQIAEKTGLSVAKTKILLNQQLDTISIDSLITDNEIDEIYNIIDDNILVEDLVTTRVDFLIVKQMFSILSKKEITVLNLRFGLEDGIEKSLEEVGDCLNVTGEWIRQIENRALNKIRFEFKKRKLKGLKNDNLKECEVKFQKKKSEKKKYVNKFIYKK